MKAIGCKGAVAALVLAAGMGSAQAQDLKKMEGWLGLGVSVNALNFGIGPTAEYWFTPQIAGSVTASLTGFTGFAARGTWLFDKPYALSGITFYPYAAAGFAQYEKSSYEGNGIEIGGGLMHMGLLGRPNIGWGYELLYSTVEFKVEDCTGCGSVGYSSFGVGLKILYYFKPDF